MKALLLRNYKELEMTDMPTPDPAPGQVLIRVKACGICGSDVHGFDGSSGRRIPPIVMGHEAAGVVAGLGDGVTGLKEGDRVTFDSTVSCGDCFFCRRGNINLCDNRQVLGVSCGDFRRHGAFAEYVAVPRRIVYKLPDSLSFEKAAIIEAVSVAVHAVGLTPVKLGDTALVVGTGMVGLLVVQALRLAGCGRIIAADVDPAKLAMARQFGTDDCVNPKESDVTAFVHAFTEGRGVDRAVEVVGATAPIQTALAAVRKGGTLTLVGNITPKIELPLQSVVTREVTLIGSCISAGEYPACIELMARGAVNVDPLISAVAPLEDGPAWFQRLYAREPNLMKVVLQP
jgi:L-iditol 2-dehydrogenase